MLKTAMTDAGTETTILTQKTYDITKKLAQFVLPALASLYFGLSQIWGLPKGEEVVGTIALFTTFLGAVVGVSHNRYTNSDAAYDGKMVVTEDGGGLKTVNLELADDPENLTHMKSVAFKVQKTHPPL